MTIHFHCGCGQKLKASAASVGKRFDCPVCGATVTVPEKDEDAVVAATAAAPAPDGAAATPAKKNARKTVSIDSNGSSRAAGELSAGEGAAGDPASSGREARREPSANDTQELLAESDTILAAESETQVAESAADLPAAPNRRDDERDESNGRSAKSRSPQKSALPSEGGEEPLLPPDPLLRRTYASDSAQDHVAADTARDLFKLVRKMKKEEKPPEKTKKKPVKSDEERFDFGGLLKELGTTVLPGALAIFVACFGAYWIASSVMASGRELPELGDVYGVVTLDGKPLPHASILFRPVADDPDTLSRISASTAMTDEQGRYELSYVEDVSGAAVGAHEVVISAPLPNGRERLRRIYNSATTLVREVQAGNNELNFELASK